MYCEKCGSKTTCVSTAATSGEVYRQRVCKKCGEKYITVEQISTLTEDSYMLHKLRNANRR